MRERGRERHGKEGGRGRVGVDEMRKGGGGKEGGEGTAEGTEGREQRGGEDERNKREEEGIWYMKAGMERGKGGRT